MNRIEALFSRKDNNVLNVYFTVGHPHLHSAPEIVSALEHSGVDLIELGMPYSDPLADGPTIQASASAALRNGMNTDLFFDQVRQIREETEMPLVLMGNYNQVLQFGAEEFFRLSKKEGIDGMIIPDLPMDVFQSRYKKLFEDIELGISFLITPQTSDERIRQADELSTAFLYVVSKSSITGKSEKLSTTQEDYFERLKNLDLKRPNLIGFGIYDQSSFQTACSHANGAIIGSAYIRCLAEARDLKEATSNFISGILGSSNGSA